MVISKILRLLQLHRPQLRIKSIQAMHIDYGNRPESAEEAAFVMQWSHGEYVFLVYKSKLWKFAHLNKLYFLYDIILINVTMISCIIFHLR